MAFASKGGGFSNLAKKALLQNSETEKSDSTSSLNRFPEHEDKVSLVDNEDLPINTSNDDIDDNGSSTKADDENDGTQVKPKTDSRPSSLKRMLHSSPSLLKKTLRDEEERKSLIDNEETPDDEIADETKESENKSPKSSPNNEALPENKTSESKKPTVDEAKKPISGWGKLRQIQQPPEEPKTRNDTPSKQPPRESPWKRLKQHTMLDENQPPAETLETPKESPWARLKQQSKEPSAPAIDSTDPKPSAWSRLKQPSAPPGNSTSAPKESPWARLKQQSVDSSAPKVTSTGPKPSAWSRLKQPSTVQGDSTAVPKESPWAKLKQGNQTLPSPLADGENHTNTPASGFDSLADAAYAVHTTQKITGVLKERMKLKQKLALKERMKKLVQERLTIRQIFRRYVDSSTLHGFCYVASKTFMIRRIFWALLMIAGAIYFLIKLKDGVELFRSYPFTTKSSTEFLDNLVFPGISFCPINQFKSEGFSDSVLDKIYKTNGFPISNNWTDPGFDVPGDELNQAMLSQSFKIGDIAHNCDWINRDTVHPEMTKRDCGHHNFTQYFSEQGEVCYTINPGTNEHPLMFIDQSGLRFAYELTFDLRSNEAIRTHPYNGVKVILHDQHVPQVSQTGFVLTTGAKSFVRMDRIETHSLPPPFSTMCGVRSLKYFEHYSQKSCLLELLTDFVGETCGCRQPYMPDKRLPLCSLREEITCVFPTKDKFHVHEMRKSCPEDCIETTFKAQTTDLRFLHNPPLGVEPAVILSNLQPNENSSLILDLYEKMNLTEFENYVEDNIIIAVFYYGEMRKTVDIQSGTFSFYKFLGDAGGVFGLMLGASLLTFFEFVDLFAFLLYHQLLRLHKQKKSEEDNDSMEMDSKNNNASKVEKKKNKKKEKGKDNNEDTELSNMI